MMDFTKPKRNNNLYQELYQDGLTVPDFNQYRPQENPALMHEAGNIAPKKPQIGLFKDILSSSMLGAAQGENAGEMVGGALGGLAMTFLNRKFNKNK